jgi:PBP1b-binding outer membrane lipoprotein LpoB
MISKKTSVKVIILLILTSLVLVACSQEATPEERSQKKLLPVKR